MAAHIEASLRDANQLLRNAFGPSSSPKRGVVQVRASVQRESTHERDRTLLLRIEVEDHGLVIARRLAALMGGEVGVSSRPGAGGIFWMTAQLARTEPASRGAFAPLPESSAEQSLRRDHGGTRVLMVDDDPVNQEITHALLKRVGLAVDVAGDGAVAVERVRDYEYALVLMDVQMPVLDGLEATRASRRLPARGTLPVIAMTANAFADERAACFAAGMDDHISKPVEPGRLYARLLHWLTAASTQS